MLNGILVFLIRATTEAPIPAYRLSVRVGLSTKRSKLPTLKLLRPNWYTNLLRKRSICTWIQRRKALSGGCYPLQCVGSNREPTFEEMEEYFQEHIKNKPFLRRVPQLSVFFVLLQLSLFSAAQRKTGGNRSSMANFLAFAASDTFCMVDLSYRADLHRTSPFTLFASGTLLQVYMVFVYRYLIKQSINCAKWTDIFAERTINQYRQKHSNNKNRQLPLKKKSDYTLQRRICGN